MGFNCGIVGLPNVGKSTIFNALTSAGAQASNYPFTTIDPNVGVVDMPDERLDKLAEIYVPKKLTPTSMEFVDIAGLVKGAAQGEGLGNKFLANIREVDAIAHVVRCFEDPNVIHVAGKVDPKEDIEVIEAELMLADLDAIEKRLYKAEKMTKTGDKKAVEEVEFMRRLKDMLAKGEPDPAGGAFRGRDAVAQELRVVVLQTRAVCGERGRGHGRQAEPSCGCGKRRSPQRKAQRSWSFPARWKARSPSFRRKSARSTSPAWGSRSRASTG